MFEWIDEKSYMQIYWAQGYLAKKFSLPMHKLMALPGEDQVKMFCDVVTGEYGDDQDKIERLIKSMKVADRKRLSREKKKGAISADKTKEYQFSLPKHTHYILNELAENQGVTMSHLVTNLILAEEERVRKAKNRDPFI